MMYAAAHVGSVQYISAALTQENGVENLMYSLLICYMC
jgi:hypothetical protein